MRDEVMDALREWYPQLAAGHTVLELGSRWAHGGVPQTLFTGEHAYTGIDMLEGQGVDLALNFHDLHTVFKAHSVDTVLCLETLEHDDRFWLTLEQVARVLKRGGHFVLSVPTEGYLWYHPYPQDYYRFTRDAFDEVLMDPSLYELLDIQEGNTDGRIDGLVGIGKRR